MTSSFSSPTLSRPYSNWMNFLFPERFSLIFSKFFSNNIFFGNGLVNIKLPNLLAATKRDVDSNEISIEVKYHVNNCHQQHSSFI
ncbi:GPN-loop GTPase [Dirofilaria immitis]